MSRSSETASSYIGMLEGMLCFLTDVILSSLALLWACCAFLVKLRLFILGFDHLLFVVFVIQKLLNALRWEGGIWHPDNTESYPSLSMSNENSEDLLVVYVDHIVTYLLTPWSRVLLEKLTSKLCS